MSKSYPLADIQHLLEPAQNILVVLAGSATFDQIASGLALSLALQKAGKQAAVLSPEEMRVEFSHLVGVDKVSDKVPAGELVLTINSPLDTIEKVTSSDESGKLCLTIKPKAGLAPVKKEDIIFSESGGIADLIFVIEAKRLESLGRVYQENINLFKEKPIINISRFQKVDQFGKVNMVDSQASSCSEIVVFLLQGLNLLFDADISSNLLLGLREATQNFQIPATSADTFEAAATCAKNGATRNQNPPKTNEESNPPVAQPSPDWYEPKIFKGSTLP
ncbi:MAG: hypothetical protein Q7S03_02645 [bacterium]|nr:hypothetical protein [bacterium]